MSIDAVIYIHGFQGSSSSPKVSSMRSHFEPKGVKVFAPSYATKQAHKSHDHLVSEIASILKQHPHAVLVGCSLGGFWAQTMSNYFHLPSVLLNPAMRPWEQLDKYIGVEPGFTKQHAAEFKNFQFKNARPQTVHEPRIVLTEKDDDVVDPVQTMKDFEGHAKTKMLPGGSHRFDAHDEMIKAVEEVGNTVLTHGA